VVLAIDNKRGHILNLVRLDSTKMPNLKKAETGLSNIFHRKKMPGT
jgi:hypothetical protein